MASRYGHRVEGWQYQILDQYDNLVADLDGVIQGSGSFEQNVDADVRGSGSFVLDLIDPDIDWESMRIRVWYRQRGLEPYPVLTALPSIPQESHTGPVVQARVGLLDKTSILQSELGHSYGVAAGSNILNKVRDLIFEVGEDPTFLSLSSKVLSTALSWDPTTTYLRVINDLLNAAGYFSISTDGLGRFKAVPYVDPSKRPILWNFRDNAQGLYLPSFTRNRDTRNIPNKVRVIQKTDGTAEAPYADAILPASSPYSFESRGYWKTKTIPDVESAADGGVTLQLQADRKLADAVQVTTSFDITHPVIPELALNGAVTFLNARTGAEARCVLRKLTFNSSTGGLCNGTYREVVS